MKPTLLHATAAAFAVGAISIAAAQAPAEKPASETPAAPAGTFAQEPIASASKADGPDAQLSAIVQALNGEASLKSSKITVQMDDGNVLLTGTAQSEAQVKRAGEIATASAGDAKVVNVIQPDHVEQYQKAPA